MEGTICGVAILPSPWPPPRAVELLAKEENGQRIALSVDSRGSLTAAFSQDGRTTQTHTFAPLDVAGASKVIFVLTWSPTEIQLHINGVEIPPEVPGAQAVHFPAQGDSHLLVGLVLPGLDPNAGATDDERFFLATLADMDHKVVKGDRYSLIRAAGLLRQLLLDGLVHGVNRNHRVRIEFSTLDFTRRPPAEIEIAAHWETLDPSPFPGAPTISCNLDQFLAAPCLRWKDVNANVKDLIRACANAKGGIHLGKARIEDEQVLLDWDNAFSMMGEEPSLRALAGVCRVVLVGLRGLAEAVMRGGIPRGR